MTLLLIYLAVALITSFLCSIMEAVLLSVPISYLMSKAEQQDQGAKRMIHFKEDIDKPLSAILSLNTVAHTVGAAGVGAQAAVVFGDAYFGVVSAVLTILILVFTEIIPKTVGANYSRELVGPVSLLIKIILFITYPLVMISSILTKLLARKDKEFTTSRAEIATLSTIGTQEGIFGDQENRIIQNLIRLKEVKISEVMTPRVVMVAANQEMMLSEFLEKKEFLYFSRIPVFEGIREQISGYVLRSTVLEHLAEDKFEMCLKDVKRPILTFPESNDLFTVWNTLSKNKEHIALIADEYGGVDGIATLEDIIETLLGFEILDEKDKFEDMQDYALQKWEAKQKKYALLKKNDDQQS